MVRGTKFPDVEILRVRDGQPTEARCKHCGGFWNRMVQSSLGITANPVTFTAWLSSHPVPAAIVGEAPVLKLLVSFCAGLLVGYVAGALVGEAAALDTDGWRDGRG